MARYTDFAAALKNEGGPYFADNTPAMLALEAMIDKAGLRNVTWALASICREKADHVRSNWQDEHTAKTWESDARRLDRVAGMLAG